MTQDFNSAATEIPLHVQLFKAAMQGDLTATNRLITAGAAIMSRNTSGHTPLMLAATRGHVDVAAALLDAGAEINALSNGGASALAMTVGQEDRAMADLLLSRGADPLAGHASNHKNLLRAAVGWGQEQLFTTLVAGGTDFRFEDEGGRTLVMLACSSDQPRMLELLIASGMEVSKTDKGSAKAAECAAENGSDSCLRILLDHGVSPHGTNNYSGSLLYRAAKKGADKAVALLLESGAKPNVREDDSSAPLRIAITNGHTGCVDLLLKHSADPMNESWEGSEKKTDEQVAKDKGGEIEKLVSAAARKFHLVIAAGENDTAFMKTLLDEGVPVETVDRNDMTALLQAVKERKPEAVRLLLEHHANPNYSTDYGRLPLYSAIMKIERYSERPGADPAIMDMLLGHGADPNAFHGKDKESMLWIAIEGKQAEGVVTLLKHAADPNLRNGGDERTPLYAAVLNKDLEMVTMLIEAGARAHVKDKDGVTLRSAAESTGDSQIISAIQKQYVLEMEQMGEDATRLNSQVSVFRPFRFKPGMK